MLIPDQPMLSQYFFFFPKQKKKQKVLFLNFPRIFFISLRCMKTTDYALLHAYP
jgi:hypothetical protein